jgi:hypothetical protein
MDDADANADFRRQLEEALRRPQPELATVYRLKINLTDREPRVSEVGEFAFSTHDVMAAMRHDIRPLFPEEANAIPATFWQEVRLPTT